MRQLLSILQSLLLFMPAGAGAVEPGFAVYHGSREEMRIAITVDDCYNVQCLADMLDLAQEHDIPLTFFTLGTALKTEGRALWQRVVDEGHEIGNHSYGHADLPYLQPKAALSQLTRTQDALDEVLGYHYPMQMMRPPFGHVTNSNGVSNAWVIEKAGYKRIVLWDVSQTDPDLALSAVQPGSILLYHTNFKDYHCLVKLIPALKERGYTLCTGSGQIDQIRSQGRENDHFLSGTCNGNIQPPPSTIPVQRTKVHIELAVLIRAKADGE